MKATDAYAYNRAKPGDKFLGFKGQVVEDHEAVWVTPTMVRLENGISLSRITGKVIDISTERFEIYQATSQQPNST